MKAIVNGLGGKSARPFPKLMECDGLIVFFIKEGDGIAMNTDGGWKVGEHTDRDWDMSEFRDFEGTVTLSND